MDVGRIMMRAPRRENKRREELLLTVQHIRLSLGSPVEDERRRKRRRKAGATAAAAALQQQE